MQTAVTTGETLALIGRSLAFYLAVLAADSDQVDPQLHWNWRYPVPALAAEVSDRLRGSRTAGHFLTDPHPPLHSTVCRTAAWHDSTRNRSGWLLPYA